ncbi:hypothetical protein ACVIGA_006173 [Bradyrhizobium sp. USDA 3240]
MVKVFSRLLAAVLLSSIGQAIIMNRSEAAGWNRPEAKRDDPYGCSAIVRAEMGIPRQAGYQFPEFGPRVRKCVVAHGGGSSRPQVVAERGVQQPVQAQSRKNTAERAAESQAKVADRGQINDAMKSKPRDYRYARVFQNIELSCEPWKASCAGHR